MTFSIKSSAFAQESTIPATHTCDGPDLSPPLAWSGTPEGTQSFALIVDDPDAPDPAAPKMTWVHWVLYNLPAGCRELAEGTTAENKPVGSREGVNDWKQRGYRGPCPPVGRHRYFFKLHALDAQLADLGAPTKATLTGAMNGHVLGTATLIGTYARR